MSHVLELKCPMCHGKSGFPIWGYRDEGFFSCRQCTVKWIFSSSEEIYDPKVYDKAYYTNNYISRAEQLRLFFSEQLKKIEKSVRPSRVMDIGFGTGIFLEEAKKRGWRVFGLESSQSALEVASSYVSENGNLRMGDVNVLESEGGGYGLVTFWDVLAHVPAPLAYLSCARRLLEKSGLLVIKTPVRSERYFWITRYFFGRLQKSLVHWPMQLFHFNQRSLEVGLDHSGFEIVGLEIIDPPRRPPENYLRLLLHPRGLIHFLSHSILTFFYPERSLLVWAKPR